MLFYYFNIQYFYVNIYNKKKNSLLMDISIYCLSVFISLQLNVSECITFRQVLDKWHFIIIVYEKFYTKKNQIFKWICIFYIWTCTSELNIVYRTNIVSLWFLQIIFFRCFELINVYILLEFTRLTCITRQFLF